ncbi:penicillin-binding transpeptidase domain-containing protein [Sporolactobacillus pectinivorans]|uniref:penicillin-binding transpeptidase domain-containing protein n=1 Tax=Sporolactobacillus pectinivorans TaxID=1591408 RepID=UPI000C268F85|nr:penicillin-binding transpeptidase domain-containing protein [Sporolactobacillus pectinivorans]
MGSMSLLSEIEQKIVKLIQEYAPITVNEFLNRFSKSAHLDSDKLNHALNQLGEKEVIHFEGEVIPLMSPVIEKESDQLCDLSNYCVFSVNRVRYENLSSYFGKYKGCFVLLDKNSKKYFISDKSLRGVQRVPPDSTYKIYSALAGLENGVISVQNSTLPWDRKIYSIESWNKEQNLISAIQHSVNWYFQKIDQIVGVEKLRNFYTRIGYGNCDLSNSLDSYWFDSTLKISPIEQIQVFQKFFCNCLEFDDQNINQLKSILRISQKHETVLFGKTGTGFTNDKVTNGWFIGAVEKKDNTLFFATNIQGNDKASGEKAKEITLQILNAKNIYPL